MVGGISGWQLMILLLIVVLVFGTKRLRNIGSDLGSAVKGFRKGMEDGTDESEPEKLQADSGVEESTEKAEEPTARAPGSDA